MSNSVSGGEENIDYEAEFYRIAGRALPEGVEIVDVEPEAEQQTSEPGYRRAIGGALVGVLALAISFVGLSDSHMDIFGDKGRPTTENERVDMARKQLAANLEEDGVPAEDLFYALYWGDSEWVDSHKGANGLLGMMVFDTGVSAVAFDDCVKDSNRGYKRDDIDFKRKIVHVNDDAEVNVDVELPSGSTLNFNYVADPDNEIGFNLKPADTGTADELGVMGCKGYQNPVTGKINE